MMLQQLFKLTVFTGIAYACYLLLAFFMQRQILYPGRSIRVNGQPPAGIIQIEIVSDIRVEAWFSI